MKELIEVLRAVKPDVDFEKETALVDDRLLDSLDIISIIAELTDAYDVVISPDDITPENFNSAKAIFDMIQELM